MRAIGRRLALYVVTAWVAITVNFIIPRLMPGNPIQTMIGKLTNQVTPQEIAAIRSAFGVGLSQNWWVQYWHYLGQLVHGNLGVSITLSTPVTTVLRSAIPWTIGLIGIATVVELRPGHRVGRAPGLDPGVQARQPDPGRHLLPGGALLLPRHGRLLDLRQPPRVVPRPGPLQPQLTPGFDWSYIASVIRYGELPALTIILSSIAGWMLGMRNMMITTVAEDYVLMAVAKGLPRRRVIWHAARNAVLPSIANLSLAIGLVVSGALLVELVFNYPGVGDLLFHAVANEDYPLIQGIFLVITLCVLAMNFLADIVYFALDPRTRTPAVV